MAEEYLKQFKNLEYKIKVNENAVEFFKNQIKAKQGELEQLAEISDVVESLKKLEEFRKTGKCEPVITDGVDIGEMTNELYQKALSEYHGIYYYVKNLGKNLETSLTPSMEAKCSLCRDSHPLIAKKYQQGSEVFVICLRDKVIMPCASYRADGSLKTLVI